MSVSDNIALRLALAAKAIPDLELDKFVSLLIELCGEPLSEKKFRSISPKDLRELFAQQPFTVEAAQINQVNAILSSDELSAMQAPELPSPKKLDGTLLRVAVSSNNQEQIDGHFGSCLRFLVYEVSKDGYQLVEVRPVVHNLKGEARTIYLLELISDCQLLATLSIGGPAAAKLSRANILPLKQIQPQVSDVVLERLHQVMQGSLPRWLEKLLTGTAPSVEAKYGCDCDDCDCDGDCDCHAEDKAQEEECACSCQH